jgi:phosphoribosylformylglycinamidine (FGAM) synthase-like enzyme
VKDGLYRHYIKRATNEIRESAASDDICVSVFKDNAGAIIFDDQPWLITDKVETHNSPSALDPFGGAITGIVGVNRDCMGFGQGRKTGHQPLRFLPSPIRAPQTGILPRQRQAK